MKDHSPNDTPKRNVAHKAIYAQYLITNSLDYICAADNDGLIIEFNPAAEKAFGYELESLRNVKLSSIFANEQEAARVAGELERTGKYTGEVLNRRKNGEEFTCFLSASILYDDDGKVIGSMGVSRDITTEKLLVAQLEFQNQESAELLKKFKDLSKIATSVMNGIVLTDVSGKIKWCNDSFLRITGYSRKELLGYRPSQVLRIPHFFQEVFHRDIAGKLSFEKPVEVPHYRKNGEFYWLSIESTPVYDKKGNLIEIIEVCTEITKRKRAELALMESEQNFRQISEAIDDVFFLYNIVEQCYEYVSPSVDKVLGVSADYFYANGLYESEYIIPEDRYLVRAGRVGVMNGIPYDVEYRSLIDGEIRWIRERVFPISNQDGEVIKGSGICTDITQQKNDRDLIESQNLDIKQSISYAERIQKATIHEPTDIDSIANEFFVMYHPKGQLSGDFYVIEVITTNDGEKWPVFVVADCTGHGVPGAILSILCSSLIKQSLTNHDIHSPAEALDHIRNQMRKLFNSAEGDQMKDGMDVGFAAFNPEKKIWTYAGANHSCYILRENEWIELRGVRQHVGYVENPVPFKNESFSCQSGDHIYLFTDGFADQFGGEHNKKYMKRHFLDFLKSNAHKSLAEQRKCLFEEFEKWKGDLEQTDDVCVFGMKVE